MSVTHGLDRWMYRGGHPHRVARLLNRCGAVVFGYLEVAPGARAHIPVDRHAPVGDFAEIAPRIPVFRITPGRQGS